MSPSSLHRHFKIATGLAPLQFQKNLRLQEARRLILSENTLVSIAAFAVGYESPAQFSREYRRAFGCSPADDAKLNGNRVGRGQ
ncbi:MAG: helix-turn-helix transcriptional regulator [Chelatococcus sp.]|nr:helix-turn-helix transcriptional regulator [Chelatococcus sp.]